MSSRFLIICVIGVIYFITSEALNIRKCSSDPICIKQSTQALVPELAKGTKGLRPLDPLLIKYIDGSSSKIQFKANDVVVTGLKNCAIDNISRDVTASKLNLNLLCSVLVEGEYSIQGNLHALPFNGNGHLNVVMTKILLRLVIDLEDVGIEGNTHWNIKGWDFSYILKEKAKIDLSNLFKRTAKPSEAVTKLLGVIANDLVMEVGSPIVKAIASEVVVTVNDFFHLIPVEELIVN